MAKKKICFVVAVPITAQAFLHDHIEALSKEYSVYLVANIHDDVDVEGLALSGWHSIGIKRGISFWNDFKSICQTYQYFRTMRFDVVHSVTPKAGLVTAIAGRLALVRHRIHIFTGQVWVTRRGLMRWLLKSIDRLIAKMDNHILVDGNSQRSFLIKERVLKDGQAEVFHKGSISGVNADRFVPDAQARKEIRSQIGIKDDVLTFIFLGRLNRDKGIGELLEAFNRLINEKGKVFLLLVGHDEDNYISKLSEFQSIEDGVNFYYYGLTSHPEKILNAGDVFVLPTYREGFGTSVLEAACIGLPCICSDAYGVLDAYVEGETGLRCQVGNSDSLYNCMKQMCESPQLVKKMGERSRQRAIRDYNGARLTECWVKFYRKILE